MSRFVNLPIGLDAAQAAFFAAVTHPRSTLAIDGTETAAPEAVAFGTPLPAARLAVYQNGYRARLVECLADDYPAVQHLLGEDDFERLCHGYIAEYPPGPSLNDFGASFARYCFSHPGTHTTFAAELAQLEWALVRAVHASDAEQLSAARLAALTPEDWHSARLCPSPTLTLIGTLYPVNRYLQAFREGGAPDVPKRFEPSWVAVCRREFDVWRLDLGDEMGTLMAALIEGRPLAEAFDVLPSPADMVDAAARAGRVQQAFQQWVSAGCFARVTCDVAHEQD